jgi:Sec-independent protein translocase protein TatA
MILLSPPKILMILVIALIVLGPDKLPSTARRVGAMWSEFNRWRRHLETEVRATFPDLPSTTEIARAVRSPITLLDRLADESGASSIGQPAVPTDRAPGPPTARPDPPDPAPRAAIAEDPVALDVSSMN